MSAETYTFQLGDFRCVSISDGIQPIDADLLPTFFAGAGKADLARAFQRHGMSPDYYELQCSCLLIDSGVERILIDSGGGPFFDPHLGRLILNLAREGYQPGDIDKIVLTHGHRDHVCGGMAEDGGMLFPNARHFMARGEWEYWVSLPNTVVDAHQHAADLRFARHCLRALAGQMQLIDAGDAIAPGIRSLATPGHTRHHISVEARSGDALLLCVGDTMDLPIHVENTSWHPAWDELPEIGIQTRIGLLDRAAESEALIHSFHFPFPGVGWIRREARGFRFEPVAG